MERVGKASVYQPSWLSENERESLLTSCARKQYIVYDYALRNGGVTKITRAPKIEYYILDDDGKRPLYRWGQTEEMYHAGYEMPQELRALADRIQAESKERVNHCIIIFYEDGGAQYAPAHKDKAKGVNAMPGTPLDMAENGSFFVLSLGAEREFTLQKTRAEPPMLLSSDVVWAKSLRSGSLLKVSAIDNQKLYHAVHKQPRRGARYSIIFRTIKTHVPVDAKAAEIANGSARHFSKKRKFADLSAFVVRKST